MALNKDFPTGTKGIEDEFVRKLNVRFRNFTRDIRSFFTDNTFKVSNFEYNYNVQMINEFMAFLEDKIETNFFTGKVPEGQWYTQYLDRAYNKGILNAKEELRRSGVDVAYTADELQKVNLMGGALPSLQIGTRAVQRAIHLEALQVLYTRDYAELRGVTRAMSQQISRVLSDGVEQGKGISMIADDIIDRIDKIGLTRAKLLARTEVIRAYNLSKINEGKDLAKIYEEPVFYKWRTAGDSRVREEHQERNGNIYSAEKAMGLIGEANCRCRLDLIAESDIEEGEKVIS